MPSDSRAHGRGLLPDPSTLARPPGGAVCRIPRGTLRIATRNRSHRRARQESAARGGHWSDRRSAAPRLTVKTPLRWREVPSTHAKFTNYSSKMRKRRLHPPISVPILKARSSARDGGRPRMKTPPRPRTAVLDEQRKRAGNLAGVRSLSPASSRLGGEQPFSLAFGNDQDAPTPVVREAAPQRGRPPKPVLYFPVTPDRRSVDVRRHLVVIARLRAPPAPA